jgi:hypothetical protein
MPLGRFGIAEAEGAGSSVGEVARGWVKREEGQDRNWAVISILYMEMVEVLG